MVNKEDIKPGQKIETKEGVFEVINVGKIYSLNNKDFEEAIVANINGMPTKVRFEDVIKIIEEEKKEK